MPFISYAQNMEDVMLWRVFKEIPSGCYIDVGAHDPIFDSVTKAFYENGWRGINIEPLKQYYDKLLVDRPKDINLNVAISNQTGEATLYDIGGLSTLLSEIAEHHAAQGIPHALKQVPVMPLSAVCQKYIKKEIHFLKIDVEGLETQVLLSMDFKQFRPWIVVVEATYPNTQKPTHAEWENILINQHYCAVYCDGLNRYYLAEEHIELKSYFEFPPNVFDQYVTFRYVELQKQNHGLQQMLESAKHSIDEQERAHDRSIETMKKETYDKILKLEEKYMQLLKTAEDALLAKQQLLYQSDAAVVDLKRLLSQVKQESHSYQEKNHALLHSCSWCITAPLRRTSGLCRKVLRKVKSIAIKSILIRKSRIALEVNQEDPLEDQTTKILNQVSEALSKTPVHEDARDR